MNTKVIISPFCQARDQQFCKVPLENLLIEIKANLHQAKPGYREGVIIVPISPAPFRAAIRTLQAGDVLTGNYVSRQQGEEPRKTVKVASLEADPVVAVDAVLYSRDTLAEGGENSDLSADYEVVTILVKISEDQPMPPETLMANHFLADGGTQTNMTAEEFESALRKSFNFWKNKALVETPDPSKASKSKASKSKAKDFKPGEFFIAETFLQLNEKDPEDYSQVLVTCGFKVTKSGKIINLADNEVEDYIGNQPATPATKAQAKEAAQLALKAVEAEKVRISQEDDEDDDAAWSGDIGCTG